MKNNPVTRSVIFILLGAVLLAIGFFAVGDNLKSVSGFCIGIGLALIVMNIMNLILNHYYKKHPAVKKQSDIELKDERTVAITNQAKAKAFDIMLKILFVIPFIMILFDLPLWMMLSTIALYVFGLSVQMYFAVRYHKEM